MADPMRVDVVTEGAAETLAAFKALPKEASDELRTAALKLAELLAARVAASGRAEGRQAARLAGTVKPKRDRIPSIKIGGTAKVFRGEKDSSGREAYRPMTGSEFGGQGHGFKAANSAGYWITPAVKAAGDEIMAAWTEAAEEIIDRFTESP